ncbi:hypothetical protein EVAR_17927_1 [Eumeta japonica]|uniref:Uncharacterized protein n=1 Tax=Eumeta variegata TaxID=151549 RepID=A0A4C1UYA4_EUMVA|nr:hypothetical protein EVAR_17927_1 [Eumeta japonica]
MGELSVKRLLYVDNQAILALSAFELQMITKTDNYVKVTTLARQPVAILTQAQVDLELLVAFFILYRYLPTIITGLPLRDVVNMTSS